MLGAGHREDGGTLPGVESAAIASLLPVTYNGNTDWIRFVGKPYDGKHIEVNERDVSSDYFRTIGATLIRGRYFTDAEDESQAKVLIINQALAKKYFPGEDPIGKQVGDTSLTPKSIKTIIGVVDDMQGRLARLRDLAGRISPVQSRPKHLFFGDCAHFARARLGTSSAGSRDPSASQRSRNVRRSHDERTHRQFNDGLFAPLFRFLAGGGFCLNGAAVGSGWTVRRDCAFGKSADAQIGVRMAMGAENASPYTG